MLRCCVASLAATLVEARNEMAGCAVLVAIEAAGGRQQASEGAGARASIEERERERAMLEGIASWCSRLGDVS